jgi:hypothetical protein
MSDVLTPTGSVRKTLKTAGSDGTGICNRCGFRDPTTSHTVKATCLNTLLAILGLSQHCQFLLLRFEKASDGQSAKNSHGTAAQR